MLHSAHNTCSTMEGMSARERGEGEIEGGRDRERGGSSSKIVKSKEINDPL